MSDFTMRTHAAIRALGGEAKIVDGVMVVTGDIGLSHYPIFDEEYRPILNGKIVRHFWNEEIGVETPELWKFNLQTDMAENMPYFNQLYESEKRVFDPFSTVDLRTFTTANRTQATESEQASMTEQGGQSATLAVNSALPGNQLSRNKDYATSSASSEGSNTSSGTGSETIDATVTDDGETDTLMSGYQGLTSDMLMRFRETFLNLDKTVIDSLTDNFMLIRASGSRFTDRYTIERYTL